MKVYAVYNNEISEYYALDYGFFFDSAIQATLYETLDEAEEVRKYLCGFRAFENKEIEIHEIEWRITNTWTLF